MNIRVLSYFSEVAKEKNFTRAANNLHLSQPALSKVIKNLESDLDVSLIDRTSKYFKLTDKGEIFYENVQTALQNINLELDQLYSSINSTNGKIIVGIPPVISTVYFKSFIAKFKVKYPNIDLVLVEEGANNIKEKVEKSKIDVGIVILPLISDKLNTMEIINSETVLIVHKDHKLVNKEKVIMNDLKDESFITLNKNYMLYNTLNTLCNKVGFDPKIEMESSQWDFIAEMVSLNQGIALLPKPIV